MIEMTPVENSSTIEAMGYDGSTLRIKFKSGSAYLYKAVPEKVFKELVYAKSAGKAFASLVRGKFEAVKDDKNV